MKNPWKNIITKFYLLFLSGWVLSACDMPPEVSVPISEPGQVEFDSKLLGQWYASDANGDSITIVSAIESSNGMIIGDFFILEDSGVENKVARIRAQVHASEIDGELYYNIQRIGDNFAEDGSTRGESSSYIITKLEVGDDGVLSIKTLGGNYLEELIESDQVKGHTEEDNLYGDYLVLDVTREELIDLIQSHPTESLFNYIGSEDIPNVFRRLNSTY